MLQGFNNTTTGLDHSSSVYLVCSRTTLEALIDSSEVSELHENRPECDLLNWAYSIKDCVTDPERWLASFKDSFFPSNLCPYNKISQLHLYKSI